MGQGVGVSAEEFRLLHFRYLKHLWSNLRVMGGAGGDRVHSLRIRCDWQTAAEPPADRHLEFGLALTNDRLYS